MSSHRAWMPRALLALLAASALAGCASPDGPTPRRPILPQAVQDLQARQQGESVVLTFTLPNQSTRKESLAAPPAIEIYRGAADAAGKPPEKTSTRLVYTIPGEMAASYQTDGRIVYRDAIDPGELARAGGAGADRIYVVRTRVERNRASAESNRVIARIHPPPEPVGKIAALMAGQSVNVLWAPSTVTILNHVYRAEITPESAAAAAMDASKAILLTPLTMVREMTSFAGGVGPVVFGEGRLEPGHTYLYIVRRVAQFGPDTVESADSDPAVITFAEIPPPAAPQEVEAVVVPATPQTAAYVSLSWAISAEAGLAGYQVYRSEQADAPGAKLNENLLEAPTYRDLSVAPGRRYFYSVTAFDGASQESAPSAAVDAQIPAQ